MMNRQHALQAFQEEEFDLLVIGGGITGVGIALDAQSRGLKTALIEKQDFAAGTSSRSTKLIHGGLRYLKQFQIKLVREVGSERAIIHRLAPHLVHPEKMLLPLVKEGNYGPLMTSLGLGVYDWLAGVKGDDRRRMLSKAKTLEKEPLLRTDILKGGGYYAEYRTDDARLTISIAKTAAEKGVQLANYCEAKDFEYQEDHICGLECRDLLGEKSFSIRAKKIVNATGPWVDELRKIDQSLNEKHLHLTKGIHLVVPYESFPVQQSLYFDNTDGRMIFAIPRGRITYIGTTDTSYYGNKENPLITKEDQDYVIDAVNYMFPEVHLKAEDIESSWAGLRPLINEEGKSPSELSRKDEIFISERGLISIAGGKLTGYRKMAERVVDLVYQKLDLSPPKCKTDRMVLRGGEFNDYEQVQAHIDKLQNQYPAYLKTRKIAEALVFNFGRESEQILKRVDPSEENKSLALVLAELDYCLEKEMCETLLDFYDRRTGRLYFNILSIEPSREAVIEKMKAHFNWSVIRAEREGQLLEEAIYRATHFADTEEMAEQN